MNEYQKTYIATKAHHESTERDLDEKEEAFCKSKGYKTDTGDLATRLYMIDDDDLFDVASAEFYTLYELNRRF